MKAILRSGFPALAIVALTVPVNAGPWEDGGAAFNRGDYATALKLWRPLAERDNAAAQGNLGNMYENGRGVAQDYAEAVKWLGKAADQGNVEAMHNLGLMYAKGQGVPQDYMEAYKWSDLAASHQRPGKKRDDSVHDRNILAKRMTPDQIAEAQRMAADADGPQRHSPSRS